MEEEIMINLAYKNICFMKFFDYSMANLTVVMNTLSKNENLNSIFPTKNKEYLVQYTQEKQLEENKSQNATMKKKNILKDWAKSKKISISSNLRKSEINTLADSIISSTVQKITDKANKVLIDLLLPEIIENLESSFNLLMKWKNLLKNDITEEQNKYTSLLNDNLNKDKQFEDYKNSSKKEKKNLSNTVKKLTEENSGLNNKIGALEKVIAELEKSNGELTEKCEEYKGFIREYSQSEIFQKYEKSKELNEQICSENNYRIIENEDLINKINCYKEIESKLNSQINELKNSDAIKTQKINELENEVSSYKNQVSSLENQVSSLENQVSSLENQVSSLKKQVSSLENQISLLKNENTGLKEELKNQKEEFESRIQIIVEEKVKDQLKKLKIV